MVAVGLAWLIVRRSDDTIYRSQLKSRADAPAQRLLAGLPLLAAIPTTRAMAKPRVVLGAAASLAEADRALARERHLRGPRWSTGRVVSRAPCARSASALPTTARAPVGGVGRRRCAGGFGDRAGSTWRWMSLTEAPLGVGGRAR